MPARHPRHAPETVKNAGPAAARPALAWQSRHGLLAAVMACLVARVLIPSESAVDDVAGMFFALAWIVIGALTALEAWRRPSASWRPTGSELAVFALAAWYGVSAFMALRTGSPRPALNAAFLWLSFAAGYVALRRLIQGLAEQRAVIAVMVGLAFAESCLGIEQYAIEMPATLAAYRANPNPALRELNIPTDRESRERTLFEQRLESKEPFATFALANSLAGFLTPWFIVSAFVAAQALLGQPQRRWPWLGPLITAAPIAVCLLLTKSRSAYLAVAAGLLAGALLQPMLRRRLSPRWLLSGVGVLAVLIVIGGTVGALDREIITEAGKSLGYRTQYWRASLRMIGDHPLLGVGPGQYQTVYTQYKAPEASEVVADPHNFLFEVTATAGIPALVLLLSFFAFAVREWRCTRAHALDKSNSHASPATLWIIGGGLLGFAVAFPVGLLAFSMPGYSAFVVCLPAMLMALALWHAWGREGSLDRHLPLIAAGALLVNLLAAGGIGIPAVSNTLWLLFALCTQPASALISDEPRRPWYPAALTIALGAAFVAAYFLAFRPMTSVEAEWQLADKDRRHAERHLLAATQADPHAAMPWRRLAAWRYERWQREPTAERWQSVADAMREDLARTPRSAVAWAHAGAWHREAFERMGDQAALREAIAAFETAVAFYPNAAAHHADLAEALALAGDTRRAKTEAQEALALDDLTPHLDLKLDERREEMRQLADGANGGD